ncbi:trace amine-associated receptor 13c-like [Oncorhynchus clarkii lewisi]|uniref:trace amine-associated receptor 13c-like n=1 Tax=Oncorhynchus clarkii lewisi TaxID=490388 RepID=UPI0039B97F38
MIKVTPSPREGDMFDANITQRRNRGACLQKVGRNWQLHTTTNLLILSLAASDLLVGLIVIPVMTVAIMEPCWGFGEYFCVFQIYIASLCTSLSLGNLVLISIDRYVAVCDPLLYHSKITTTRIRCCISISWCYCIIYRAANIQYFVNVQVPSRCLKECTTFEGSIWVNFTDLVITMVVPCSVIITLYVKIFVVARSQARKHNSAGDHSRHYHNSHYITAAMSGVTQ